MKVGRRKLIAGAATAVAGTAFGVEWWTFQGHLDHRRSPGAAGVRLPNTEREGVVHIGHSTHIIQLGGLRFLTDPWFYDPAFGALSHAVPPAVLPTELGALDAILISHDHADHADLRALAEMAPKSSGATVIVSTEELAAKLRALGFKDVSVLARDQERKVGPVVVLGTEAVHDIYEVGFILRRGDRCVYFAGDTALHGSLDAIGKAHRPNIVVLPCDGTRVIGGALHVMRPQDAVVAAGKLGAKVIVPSHAEAYFSDPIAGNFLASIEPDAIARLHAGVEKELRGVYCARPRPGELIELDPPTDAASTEKKGRF